MRFSLGYLPQNPGFHDWMTGREFLIYVGQLAGLSQVEAKERSMAIMGRLRLETAANRSIGGYSGGMKQRLGICQALIHRPQLLILDEPVSALDPVGRREILELLADLRGETTVLYSTHVLHDAEEISDDILMLVGGQLVVAGAVEELRERYQRPKIELTAAASLEPFAAVWSTLSSVDRVEGVGNRMTLVANDLSNAREQVLETLLKHHIPIQRLEFGQSTLEKLFMEVVRV